MKTIIYNNKDEATKAANHKEVGRQLLELPPGEYVIKIVKNRHIRSLSKNAEYHAIWHIYAIHTGHYIDELKKEFYDKIGFYTFHTDSRGKTTKRYKSSADCDEVEMQALINQQAQWGRDEFPEVVIPKPQDRTYELWFEIQNQYNRTFSGW
jgi:hypothetical protein